MGDQHNDGRTCHQIGAGSTGVYACVVDAKPKFELELLRWFACLTFSAGVQPTELVVSVVGGQRSRAVDYLRSRGVNVLAIEPFDSRSPHCNKIAAARALSEALAPLDGTVVLTDTDVAVLNDARMTPLKRNDFALKPVDAPYPPLEVLTSIYDAAGLPHPPLTKLYHVPSARSFVTNANGGVYILRAKLLRRVSLEWAAWALWMLDRQPMLRDWQVHVDQVAMGLALAAIGCRPELLDVRWNFPIHVPTWIWPDSPTPAIIHYHDYVRANGMIRTVGEQAIDDSINRANADLHSLQRASWAARIVWSRCVLDNKIRLRTRQVRTLTSHVLALTSLRRIAKA